MRVREIFQTVGTIASLIFSAGAVFLAYLSYDLSQSADNRLKEDLGFSRIGCCSPLKVEFEDGEPVALYRDVDAYISNRSLNPLTLVTCYEQGTSTWALGVAGNDCRATTLHKSNGSQIDLPYEMNGGEVITMKQRDSFPLRDDAKDAYADFVEAQPNGDFIQYICEEGLSLVTLASLMPYLNCLHVHEIEQSTRSWVTLITSRGNAFQSPDLSQL